MTHTAAAVISALFLARLPGHNLANNKETAIKLFLTLSLRHYAITVTCVFGKGSGQLYSYMYFALHVSASLVDILHKHQYMQAWVLGVCACIVFPFLVYHSSVHLIPPPLQLYTLTSPQHTHTVMIGHCNAVHVTSNLYHLTV